jgi:hypothetical protein
MSSVVISGDTSGSISLTVPAVAGTNTATLPAATGTVMVSGNMPAFSAYMSAGQAFSNATFTKIAFDTKEFDTNTNFSTSNNRFTPTVAGYYQITCNFRCDTSAAEAFLILYKNGSEFKHFYDVSITQYGLGGTALVYANGSTDYFEMYFAQYSGTSKTSSYGSANTFFQAAMVRSA